MRSHQPAYSQLPIGTRRALALSNGGELSAGILEYSAHLHDTPLPTDQPINATVMQRALVQLHIHREAHVTQPRRRVALFSQLTRERVLRAMSRRDWAWIIVTPPIRRWQSAARSWCCPPAKSPSTAPSLRGVCTSLKSPRINNWLASLALFYLKKQGIVPFMKNNCRKWKGL